MPSTSLHRPGFALPRALATLLAALLLALVAGCAGLPPPPPRDASFAVVAGDDTPLGRVARRSSPDVALSGVRLLPSGPMALHTRLELIRRAERAIDLQTFLWRDDRSGRLLLRALRDAAARGVRVRLLVDDLYSTEVETLLLGLAAHRGVEVRLFNPFPALRGTLLTRFAASPLAFDRLHRRMHNKLFVADGAMAVTGGRNIGDAYFMHQPQDNLIDLDAFVTGAVVDMLGRVFDRYWNSRLAHEIGTIVAADGDAAQRRELFEQMTDAAPAPSPEPMPPLDVLGHGPLGLELDAGRLQLTWARAEAHADPPEKTLGDAEAAALAAEGAWLRFGMEREALQAEREVVALTPYMIPGSTGMQVIESMHRRGVRLRILTNSLGSTDEPLAHAAYSRYRGRMLDLGVELYELSPSRAAQVARRGGSSSAIGGLHTKMVVFDRKRVFVGSMNIDPRSDSHNTEMGLLIDSPALAAEALQLADRIADLAAHRLRRSADGGIEWTAPGDDGTPEVLTDEPGSHPWTRLWLWLLAPLAPEHLL